jgi:hypothetical protein
MTILPSGVGGSALTITNSPTLPSGTVNIGYSQSLNSTGGILPHTWSVIAGTLPSGLQLTPQGVLNGTPLTAGTFNFTVQVRDGSSPAQDSTESSNSYHHSGSNNHDAGIAGCRCGGSLFDRAYRNWRNRSIQLVSDHGDRFLKYQSEFCYRCYCRIVHGRGHL